MVIKIISINVLLSLWPLLNFLNTNFTEINDFNAFLKAMSFVATASLILGICAAVLCRRMLKNSMAMIPLSGIALALLLNYPLFESIAYRTKLPFHPVYLWSGVVFVLIFACYKLLSNKDLLSSIFIFSIVVFVLPAIGIVGHGYRYLSSSDRAEIEDQINIQQISHIEPLPNIYYFILDGYARHDVLSKHYNYHNDSFLNFLDSKNFSTALNSYSNYPVTNMSIPSTLHMNYVIPVGYKGFEEAQKDLVFGKTMDGQLQSKVPAFNRFNQLGYHIIFAHYTGVPIRESAPYYIIGKTPMGRFQFKPLYIDLLKLTPVLDITKLLNKRIFQYSVLKDPFEAVKQTPNKLNQPFLFFGHILAPHPPYSFKADCSPRYDSSFDIDPDKDSELSNEELRFLYVNQVACVNKKMVDALNYILLRDPDAVIVLQADHGWTKGLTNEMFQTMHEARMARHSILNSVFIPNKNYADTYWYETISPVNTFRFIFGYLTNSEPDFLQDRYFYKDDQQIIEFFPEDQ